MAEKPASGGSSVEPAAAGSTDAGSTDARSTAAPAPSEPYGVLELTRLRKEDGRALLVFRRTVNP